MPSPSNHFILCRPFSSCPQSFPSSGSFQVSQLFASCDQSIGEFTITSLEKRLGAQWPCRSIFVNKELIQKSKEGRKERRNKGWEEEWLRDWHYRPNVAAAFLEDSLFSGLVATHTPDSEMPSWFRVSLSASLLMLTARFGKSHLSSKSCLLSRSPDLPSSSSPDGCLASAAGVSPHSMGAAMWHGGSLMHLLSFHDINSLRWSVSCQNCWEKRQAVLSLPRLTWRKHNLVSVFTLPSLGMYLAHLICLLSVIAWMILDFLLHTHTHTHTHTHIVQIHQENTKFPIMSSQFYEKYTNI